MLAQKIILGFGFAVVLPLLVHYGIEAFHPSVPTPESYDEVRRLRQREEQSTGDEKVQLRDQRSGWRRSCARRSAPRHACTSSSARRSALRRPWSGRSSARRRSAAASCWEESSPYHRGAARVARERAVARARARTGSPPARRGSDPPMSGVLHGVRVLEVAQWWFVPAAGAVLADWGADVIKIEHPTSGDPQRGLVTSGLVPPTGGVNFMVEQPNRGKRSVGLDLGRPAGRDLLYRLVETADVFLTNFLPAARRRLAIEVDDIRRVNPKIIYVRGHGQGARGPERERGGYDAASFWCRGGIANALTPPGAAQPVMQRAAFGDSAGGMTVAGGIAAALFHRERTGEAAVVDVSLLGTAMWIMAPDIIASKLLGIDLPVGDRTQPPNPIVNSYRTQDGRWLFLNMLQPDRYWPDLCRRLGRPDLLADPRFADGRSRFAHRAECVRELDAIFATRTLAEWRRALADAEGVWAPMQTARELADDPQAVAHGSLREVERGHGTRFTLVASPVQFDETAPALRPAPDLGQDTEEVLLALGLSWEEIAAAKEAGAVS